MQGETAMDSRQIDEALAETLTDLRVSRAERKALTQLLQQVGPDPVERANIRRRAFELARASMANAADAQILDWLEDIVKLLHVSDPSPGAAAAAEAHFSPGDDCPRVIVGQIGRARHCIDVCVFTITDDRLATALIEASRRGVAIRVLTDDQKSDDLGSDIGRLREADIAVRMDRSPFHMHHKFAIFDGSLLLNGSYNWTRSASRDNEENLVVSGDPRLIGPFSHVFERLWKALD